MDGVSAAASIIAVLQLSEAILGACYRYVGKVKDAASDVDRVIHQVGYLTTILRDLKGFADTNATMGTSTALSGLLGGNGPLAVCEKGLKELEVKLPTGPVGLRQKLQWPFESKRINEIMDRITAQVPILELALIGDNYSMTIAMKASLEDTRRREEREKVLNWLRCADPTAKHLASRRLHQPGSNSWVLNSEEFKEWRDQAGQTLWMHGIPGAGKTIICSTIIDHIEELCKQKPEARVAYYYFDFSDSDAQKLDSVLRCLIWQLCKHDEHLPQAAWMLYESCDNGRQHPSDEVLADALFSLLVQNTARQSYILIDALDECPFEDREHLFQLILDRIEKHDQAGSFNFLFTSRTELDIERRMTELNTKLQNVSIPTGCVNEDVRLHVTQFISDHRTMKDWSKDLKNEIKETIAGGAHGMFRWAVCQLDLIKNCRQAGAVRKTLRNLPKTLDDTYDRILASIPDETWEIARTALMLLTHSIRPVTLAELAEAMIVDYEGQSFDPEEQRLTSPRYVLEICSSLVSVSQGPLDMHKTPWVREKSQIERVFTWSDAYFKKLQVVQFAHFSVKEYMLLERPKASPKVARFSFSPTTAHQSIAALALVYLLDFSKGARLQLSRRDFEAFPFLAYAAQHWPEHWHRQRAEKDQDTVNGLIKRLLDTEEYQNAYINYINICRPDALVDQRNVYHSFAFHGSQAKSLDSIPQPLYYASQLGHTQLCEWLLEERGCDVNAVRGTFGQSIHIASRFGHTAVVQLLLDHGADINRSCGEYAYPLQAAAYGGHVAVVKLLLDHGAAINATGGECGTALIAACDQGHLATVRTLLDAGADLNSTRQNAGKALNIAAGTGNKALVQLLLRRGADINDPCDGQGGALYTAAASGDLDMVKMLIAAGADVNLRSGYKCNALQAACSNPDKYEEGGTIDGKKYLGIVALLLRHGADPNMHGGEYGDALQAAVEGTAAGNEDDNNIDLVKLVLDHGADINHRGGKYHSAMRACVYCGNIAGAHLLIDRGVKLDDEVFLLAVENERKSVIPRLFERGVDINAQNKSGTALQFAIKNGDTTTINTLLGHPSIDIDALGKTDEGITALNLAVERGNVDVVKRLLDRGANVNQPSNKTTCLVAAAWGSEMDIIRLLLDDGADINGHFPSQETALMQACSRKNEPLVKFLINCGADVNTWVQGQGDALQAAAFEGEEAIVKLLLASGANAKAKEGRYGSCLECAISSRNPALVQLLLDAGAYVNFSGTLQELREHDHGFGGALSASIWNPQDGLTELLIERGADINWPGREYYGTPLEEAIERDLEDIVKLLLERGADVDLVGGSLGCALSYAIDGRDHEKREKYMQLLLDAGANINLQYEGGHGCPLGTAVQKGDISIVENLLDLGADINAKAGRYLSPLYIAILEGDLDIFRLLLSRGADPNLTWDDRATCLEAASRLERETMLRELLEHGADPRLSDSAAVVAAASRGNIEAMLLLIEHGADIHVQERVPGKALHIAARNSNINMVELLLGKGVDVNSFGGEYGNALMALLGNVYGDDKNHMAAVIQVLLDAGAEVNSPPSEAHSSALHAAIDTIHENFVDQLLARGADVNAHDPRFGTALSAAARRGKFETMKKLLDKGADITLPGEKFGSPLQAAARRHRLREISHLLALGADINQVSGRTGYALHAAARHESEDGPLAMKLLLDAGADPNARGGKYETALQAAARHGSLDNVKFLLENGADPTIEGGKYGSPLKAAMAKKHYHVQNYLRRYMAARPRG